MVKRKRIIVTSSSSSDSDLQQPVVEQRKKIRRDAFLSCPLLETQAKEGKENESLSCSENSSDDADQSDLSMVTGGSQHSNAEMSIYMNSLSSQAEQFGFHAPLNQTRRSEAFQYQRLSILISIYY
jgi:hypothetical protein